MRADKQLIELFLAAYNRLGGDDYAVLEWPDEVEHHRPSVDAIAGDSRGRTIAIEHTLAEPFLGEKQDTQIFNKVFVPLESDSSLRVAGYDLELWPAVGAIPNGVDWDEIATQVRSWFNAEKDHFPDGKSTQRIQRLPFDLEVFILKDANPDGRVFVGRSGMPETLDLVIEKALKRKLPKLVETLTNSRLLLLEKDNVPGGYVAVTRIIEALEPQFPQLQRVTGIWIANTVSLKQSGHAFFYHVWPGGVTRKVYVRRDSEAAPERVEVIRFWQQTHAT
jgi:hypothetical protein